MSATADRKRETALVVNSPDYMRAVELAAFLRHCGVDAVIVTKHAVQVHPDHTRVAEEAMRAYERDWRNDGRYREPYVPADCHADG